MNETEKYLLKMPGYQVLKGALVRLRLIFASLGVHQWHNSGATDQS